MKSSLLLTIFLVMLVLAGFLIWPEMDLAVSSLFYVPGKGFPLADHPFFFGAHWIAYVGARVIGIVFVVCAVLTALRWPGAKILHVDSKGWLFLLIALMVGPGLTANVILKDHWGRARPRTVTEFGGSSNFSSAWIPQLHGHRNDSFVAGDGAFGFFLPAFAYVVPLPKKREKTSLSRRIFWCCNGLGALFGFTRIAMGAHFLSDVLFAAFFMLVVTALVHAAMFGRESTAIYWRNWLFEKGKKEVTTG